MPVSHTNRRGRTYYLHIGKKRGGGVHYYFSTKAKGSLAETMPEGYEIRESIPGQVFLVRKQPKLIEDEERAAIERELKKAPPQNLYKIEVRGKEITIFESARQPSDIEAFAPFRAFFSPAREKEFREQYATYQAVMRFLLTDADRRLFAPERFCFRGSVDDWISIGSPAPLNTLAAKYLKHLGRDSLYDLY